MEVLPLARRTNLSRNILRETFASRFQQRFSNECESLLGSNFAYQVNESLRWSFRCNWHWQAANLSVHKCTQLGFKVFSALGKLRDWISCALGLAVTAVDCFVSTYEFINTKIFSERDGFANHSRNHNCVKIFVFISATILKKLSLLLNLKNFIF